MYLDPVGLPTVGVGHLVRPEEKELYPVGKTITRQESQALLTADLARFEEAVNDLVSVSLNQNEFDALASFAFNVGIANFKKSSVLRHLNNGFRLKAADSFRLWKKADGKVLPGLVTRRQAERKLFLTPNNEERAEEEVKVAPATTTITAKTTEADGSSTQATISTPEKIESIADSFNKWADKAESVKSRVSNASWAMTAVTKLGGWGLMLFSLVQENWIESLIAAAIIIAAVWYFASAKQRETERIVNAR